MSARFYIALNKFIVSARFDAYPHELYISVHFDVNRRCAATHKSFRSLGFHDHPSPPPTAPPKLVKPADLKAALSQVQAELKAKEKELEDQKKELDQKKKDEQERGQKRKRGDDGDDSDGQGGGAGAVAGDIEEVCTNRHNNARIDILCTNRYISARIDTYTFFYFQDDIDKIDQLMGQVEDLTNQLERAQSDLKDARAGATTRNVVRTQLQRSMCMESLPDSWFNFCCFFFFYFQDDVETIDKLTDEVQALKKELNSVKIDSNASKTVLHDFIHICTISAKTHESCHLCTITILIHLIFQDDTITIDRLNTEVDELNKSGKELSAQLEEAQAKLKDAQAANRNEVCAIPLVSARFINQHVACSCCNHCNHFRMMSKKFSASVTVWMT